MTNDWEIILRAIYVWENMYESVPHFIDSIILLKNWLILLLFYLLYFIFTLIIISLFYTKWFKYLFFYFRYNVCPQFSKIIFIHQKTPYCIFSKHSRLKFVFHNDDKISWIHKTIVWSLELCIIISTLVSFWKRICDLNEYI